MTLHERALLCCQLADEEERLDIELGYQIKRIRAEQEKLSQMIDKRDALIMVRHHIIGRNS